MKTEQPTLPASLPPGSTIGMLGGGQLGRMMALAAARLGLKMHIFCPDETSPAFDVCHAHTCAAYDDEDALKTFAQSVDVVTYEFENVPAETASILAEFVPVRPGSRALKVSQDRLAEKTFIQSCGIEVAPFADITSNDDLKQAAQKIGLPAILKTRRFGYDGKGQIALHTEDDLTDALEKIGNNPAILEGFVPFGREISIIAARSATGECRIFDVAENRHENHILRETIVPASITDETAQAAKDAAEKLLIELDYIGVMALEVFLVVDPSGESIVANEIAPRVHNSGHWTEAACVTCQFEQHIRAIAGWPLGSETRLADISMLNILGFESDEWDTLAAGENAMLHLYGKGNARDGRKMGHITRVFPLGKGTQGRFS